MDGSKYLNVCEESDVGEGHAAGPLVHDFNQAKVELKRQSYLFLIFAWNSFWSRYKVQMVQFYFEKLKFDQF